MANIRVSLSPDHEKIVIEIPLASVHLMLNKRQREFLDLLGAGKVYKEIAEDMGITVRTVKYHACEVRRRIKGGRDEHDIAGVSATQPAANESNNHRA